MIRKIVYIMAAAIMVSMLVAGAVTARAEVETGQDAPNFVATDVLSGNPFDLSAQKGKTVILEWTNNQCPFVRKQYDTGNMQKTQKTATDEGAVWVSIISSAEGLQGYVSPKEAAAIVGQEGAHPTYKILDPSGKIGHMYGAKTTPHMFVIDANGKVVYQGAIDDRPSPNPKTVEGAKNYVLAALQDMAAGRPVQTPVTPPYGCGVKYAY